MLTTDETLALGAAIGRLAAASILTAQQPRCGADFDAVEEVEEAIRTIDLRLGRGAGSKAAYELRASMAAVMTVEAAASLEADAGDAVLAA